MRFLAANKKKNSPCPKGSRFPLAEWSFTNYVRRDISINEKGFSLFFNKLYCKQCCNLQMVYLIWFNEEREPKQNLINETVLYLLRSN